MVAAHVGRMAQIVTYNFLVDGLHPHSCDYIFRYYTTNFGLVLYHLIALPEFEVKPKTNRTSFSTSSQQSAAAAAHEEKKYRRTGRILPWYSCRIL